MRLDPDYVDELQGADTPPERRLWMAVLGLLCSDALMPEDRHASQVARGYVFGVESREDFELVCSLAGLDPTHIRRHLARAIQRGAPPIPLGRFSGPKKGGALRSRLPTRSGESGRAATRSRMLNGAPFNVYKDFPGQGHRVVRSTLEYLRKRGHVFENLGRGTGMFVCRDVAELASSTSASNDSSEQRQDVA